MNIKIFTKENSFALTYKIAIISLISALIFVSQLALSFAPNIELVTILISFCALIFTFKIGILICIIFSTLEGIFYGFLDWTLGYYYIWVLLFTTIFLLKHLIWTKWWLLVIIDAAFGYLFGMLYLPLRFGMYGFTASISWFISGYLFDIIHGSSNLLIALFLTIPLMKLFSKLNRNSITKKYIFFQKCPKLEFNLKNHFKIISFSKHKHF